MYSIVLTLHSLFRWLVLTGLLFGIYRAYHGWYTGKVYSRFDHSVRHWTATLAHLQLVLGLGLYSISPIINYFLHNYRNAVHIREARFFGMEHSSMMLIAILLLTIGSSKAKRKQSDKDKHKTVAIWFTIGLFIILLSIPWPFSPLVSRPFFRLLQQG